MIIYLITNIANGMQYVGKTVRSLNERWGAHIRAAEKDPVGYLHRAIVKYGKEHFERKILSVAVDESVLNTLEIFWIRQLRTREPNGYNLTDGGEGQSGLVQRPETIAKRILALTGRKRTPAQRANISAACMGRRPSPEAIAHMSRTKTGIKQSPETVAKRSAAMRGHVVSLETRLKIGRANAGRKPSPNAIINSVAARKCLAAQRHTGDTA